MIKSGVYVTENETAVSVKIFSTINNNVQIQETEILSRSDITALTVNVHVFKTDRRTDRFAISIPRVSMLTHDKNRTVINYCLQLLDAKARDDKKMTSFPKSCICMFCLNRPTQNLTVWKRWVLVKKINAIWWNIKIYIQKLVHICGYELPKNLQKKT